MSHKKLRTIVTSCPKLFKKRKFLKFGYLFWILHTIIKNYSSGEAIEGATVTMTNLENAEQLSTTTDSKGVYVSVGSNYILTPSRRGYSFYPGSKYIFFTGALSDENFTATIIRKKVRRRRF